MKKDWKSFRFSIKNLIILSFVFILSLLCISCKENLNRGNNSNNDKKIQEDDKKNLHNKDSQKKQEEKWLTIYPYKNSDEYNEIGEAEKIKSYDYEMPEEIKFVAYEEGLTVYLQEMYWNENFENLGIKKEIFVLKPEVGKPYSFNGSMAEGMPSGRLIIEKDGKFSEILLAYNGKKEETKIDIYSDNLVYNKPYGSPFVMELSKAMAMASYDMKTNNLSESNETVWNTVAYGICELPPLNFNFEESFVKMDDMILKQYHHAYFPDLKISSSPDVSQFISLINEDGHKYSVDMYIEKPKAEIEEIKKTDEIYKNKAHIYDIIVSLDDDNAKKAVSVAQSSPLNYLNPFGWDILGVRDYE